MCVGNLNVYLRYTDDRPEKIKRDGACRIQASGGCGREQGNYDDSLPNYVGDCGSKKGKRGAEIILLNT